MREISLSQWLKCDLTRRYVGCHAQTNTLLIFVAIACISMRHRCCPSSSTALRLSYRRFI